MSKTKKLNLKTYNCEGFTLVEVLVSSALFILVLLVVTSTYTVGQKIYQQSTNDNELWQNARVLVDRSTREIRQSAEIVTEIPETSTDPLDPPATELMFEDGHDTSQITYIRYYLNGTDAYREVSAYYFAAEPGIYVPWDSLDEFDNPPTQTILDNSLIGEFFSDLAFWGSDDVINTAVSLSKGEQGIDLMTAVFGRNL